MSVEDSNPQSTSSKELETTAIDRSQLIQKARAFLQSADIRDENADNKRKFLQEKGLTTEEIDILMREINRQPPPIPPRTYPPSPPSNLPLLLASLFRIISWGLGLSGLLAFVHYRFLLPRISRTLDARHALSLHQKVLMERLRNRLVDVKKVQDESYNTIISFEPEELSPDVKSLKDLTVDENGLPTQDLSTVIRCVYLESPEQKYSIDDLYTRLVEQFPAFGQRDEFKNAIARQLIRSPRYKADTEADAELWSYVDLIEAPVADSTITGLEALHQVVSQGSREKGVYGHTFKSLTDLTGYLSKETFATYNGNTGLRGYGFSNNQLSPAQEEVRREIRALKGLVLNRRSFAPIPTRITSAPAIPLASSAVAS
ncbi:hypothetical protein M422DRAFT_22920 [Sphaerobolus stellatus SS14]|nr:hypothetical protein M422DRAFT_22920 [Sphaerobolus stellatus SS14]